MENIIKRILTAIPTVQDVYITIEEMGKSKLYRVNLVYTNHQKDDFVPDIVPITSKFDDRRILGQVKQWAKLLKKGSQIHNKEISIKVA